MKDLVIVAGLHPSSAEGEAMARNRQMILNEIEAFEKPVIAAINGTCLGCAPRFSDR